MRLERLAGATWVERDFDEAVQLYQRARSADPRRPEPGWALAWLHVQRGQVGPALRACRETLAIPPSRRRELGLAARARAMESFSLSKVVARYESLYEMLARTDGSVAPCSLMRSLSVAAALR